MSESCRAPLQEQWIIDDGIKSGNKACLKMLNLLMRYKVDNK